MLAFLVVLNHFLFPLVQFGHFNFYFYITGSAQYTQNVLLHIPAAQIWLYSTSSRNQNIIFHVKTGEMAAMFNIMAAILKKNTANFLKRGMPSDSL